MVFIFSPLAPYVHIIYYDIGSVKAKGEKYGNRR